ncbi:hypothetical protein PC128_g25452 [Phytophthora cactorum]|nr:hypothetical protein PC128_g25452 [Phytophthora cactorum]
MSWINWTGSRSTYIEVGVRTAQKESTTFWAKTSWWSISLRLHVVLRILEEQTRRRPSPRRPNPLPPPPRRLVHRDRAIQVSNAEEPV